MSIPPNAYTNKLESHPNPILGSLQLLFWLVFRPSAWEHHIHQLDSSFDKNFSLLSLFTRQRWRRLPICRFLVQGFLVLPLLASLIIGLVFLSLGVPLGLVTLRELHKKDDPIVKMVYQ